MITRPFFDRIGRYFIKETFYNEEKSSDTLLECHVSFSLFSELRLSAETISVVSDTAYAPFEFKDSDQTYKGIDVDIINEVAKRKKVWGC